MTFPPCLTRTRSHPLGSGAAARCAVGPSYWRLHLSTWRSSARTTGCYLLSTSLSKLTRSERHPPPSPVSVLTDCRPGIWGSVGGRLVHAMSAGPSALTGHPSVQSSRLHKPGSVPPPSHSIHLYGRKPLSVSPAPPLAFEEAPKWDSSAGHGPCSLLGVPAAPHRFLPYLAHSPSIWGSQFPPPGGPAQVRELGESSQMVNSRLHHERSYIQE